MRKLVGWLSAVGGVLLIGVLAVLFVCAESSGATEPARQAAKQQPAKNALFPPARELAQAPTPAAVRERAADEPATLEGRAAVERFREMVDTAQQRIEQIDDYTYTLVKQERVDGQLLSPQRLLTKLRHDPFSVYVRFLAPASSRGKEAIYVEGRNNGNLIGHGVGLQALLGTQQLDPRGTIAMMGNRYPITESGMKNLLEKLEKLAEWKDLAEFAEVRVGPGEPIDERPTVLVEVNNPRQDLPVAEARIWFDREWQLPVRFRALHWIDGKPALVEDYTYLDVDFDAELTDRDFDPRNPAYDF